MPAWLSYHSDTFILTLNFIVCSITRPGTKFKTLKIDGTQHDIIHLNLTPPPNACWPQTLRYDLVEKHNDGSETVHPISLKYSILEPSLDSVLCTRGTCHQPVNPATGLCPYKTLGAMSSANWLEKMERKAKTQGPDAGSWHAAPRDGATSFLAGLGFSQEPGPCAHVMRGNQVLPGPRRRHLQVQAT